MNSIYYFLLHLVTQDYEVEVFTVVRA